MVLVVLCLIVLCMMSIRIRCLLVLFVVYCFLVIEGVAVVYYAVCFAVGVMLLGLLFVYLVGFVVWWWFDCDFDLLFVSCVMVGGCC